MLFENNEKNLVIRGAVEGEAWETGNFREICMGRIAPGLLYRSAHPVSISNDEEKIVISNAATSAGIATIINLCDTQREMKGYSKDTPWYNAIVRAGNAIALNMYYNIVLPHFCTKFAQAIHFMLNHPAPYLVHCFAGVDRTGFFAMVLESFMGAELSDIIDDYLISIYGNPIPDRSSKEYKRDAVHVQNILATMNDDCDVKDANLRTATIGYLKGKVGLGNEELMTLDKKLSENREEK